MHLPKPFFRLPRLFDAARLRQEVAALAPEAWAPHPNRIAGNSSVRLISVDGAENDLVDGCMRETEHLERTPYIRQVLASFGVPWSRTRLLKLAPGANVPTHADINYHWFYRVRLHIPVTTRPEVNFHCGGDSVHMAPGEAWVFDNWRLHSVVNPTQEERIHLVADTAGNAAFWHLVGAAGDERATALRLDYAPADNPSLLTERSVLRPVMNPAELELLVGNLRGELVEMAESHAQVRVARYHGILDSFVRDWRHLYMLYGEEQSGWQDFGRLRDAARSASTSLGEGIALRTNGVAAHQVLEGRVLRVCLGANAPGATSTVTRMRSPKAASLPDPACLERPLFIVAAPRSGSTLLFETLAANERVATLGGEAHWLIESIAELCPGASNVDSNRLLASHATAPIIERIHGQILTRLTQLKGNPTCGETCRFLEKTPKNALRIPFFDRVFPEAQFVFLWREPRGNISSILEAWRAGKWRTYPRLEGFPLPWSLLLPPGWQAMQGKSLEEIAAFQWRQTNGIIMDDLSAIPADRWTVIDYESLIAEPEAAIRRICRFAGLEFDQGLARRLRIPLPPAKHTLTAADPQKWKRNETAVEAVLPRVEATWTRLAQLKPGDAIDEPGRLQIDSRGAR